MDSLLCTRAWVVALCVSVVVVTGRSVLPPDTTLPDVKSNVIVLEVPSAGGSEPPKRVRLDGDRLFLEGKTFSSVDEMLKLLQDKEGRSVTPEPYTVVVPVARNFSSIQELFEILRSDNGTVPSAGRNHTYLPGSETVGQDYRFFLT